MTFSLYYNLLLFLIASITSNAQCTQSGMLLNVCFHVSYIEAHEMWCYRDLCHLKWNDLRTVEDQERIITKLPANLLKVLVVPKIWFSIFINLICMLKENHLVRGWSAFGRSILHWCWYLSAFSLADDL